MPRNSLTFNGIRKPWLQLLQGRSKSPFASQRNNLLRVQGMPGAYIQSIDTDVLYISQPVGFIVKDDDHALQLKDELAEWLITNESVELQFDDEPGRTYYAKLEGTIEDFQRFVDQRSGVITFICTDPYSYGNERVLNLTTDVSNVLNSGTAEANPIFELEVTEPITYAMIQNHNDEYMMIGRPVNVEDEVPYEKYERVFHSNASNLTGWTNAVQGEIDGVIDGSMIASGGRFEASDYGEGSSWHGPAIKTSLNEPLKDFRVETEIDFFNNQIEDTGRVEVYLLDVYGNQVAKLGLKDVHSGSKRAVGEIRAGSSDGHFLVGSSNSKSWNEFNGVLRIERENNIWRAYVGRIRNGQHTGRLNVEWSDDEGLYTANVAQVVVHVGQIGNRLTSEQGVRSVSVYKINHKPDGVPYIADSGDKITFDHTKNGEVLVNGEPYVDIDFGANFFKLDKGINRLVVHPSGAFDTILRYRERYR